MYMNYYSWYSMLITLILSTQVFQTQLEMGSGKDISNSFCTDSFSYDKPITQEKNEISQISTCSYTK